MKNFSGQKINISLTCTREVADEIASAIDLYTSRIERPREDEIIRGVLKAKRVIERATYNNKSI